MIGAHDTYTYMKATNWFIELFSYFWRCQKKDIDELYQLDVRCFDIRVIRENNYWVVGHGKAKVNKTFNTLEEICKYFKTNYKNSIIRIILESDGNNKSIVKVFKEECNKIINNYDKMLWSIYIKNPWTCIYKNKKEYQTIDYCCHLFNWNLGKSFIENIKNFDFSSRSIKTWAKNHNPKITQEMIENENIIYLMDYIGIY